MQRSIKNLRDQGCQVAIVEKWKKFPGMKFGVRQDVWGFGDLLACWVDSSTGEGSIALVQTTDHTSHNKHKEKILAEFKEDGEPNEIREAAQRWKAAGGLILLHSWGLRGPRGQRKRWTLREEQL